MRARLESSKLVTVFLLFVVLGSLASSVAQAKWTDGLDLLMPLALLGVIVGTLLAGTRLTATKAHVAGLLGGFLLVLWMTSRLIPPDESPGESRLGLLWQRFTDWLSVVVHGGSSYDQLLFVLTMGFIVWLLAYDSAWFVFRYGWVWWSVLPTGLVMLINLGYSRYPDNGPFIAFLIASMLLMVQSHVARKQASWRRDGLGHESGLASKALLLGGVVSILLIIIAWHGPSHSLAASVHRAIKAAQEPWKQVESKWQDAFAFLYPSSNNGGGFGAIGGGFTSFSDSFNLGGPLNLGNQPVFSATGLAPGQYWRSVAFDRYTGRSWQSANQHDPQDVAVVRGRNLDSKEYDSHLPDGFEKAQQKVTVLMPIGRTIFAGDRPVSVDRTAVWQVRQVTREGQLPVKGKLSPDVKEAGGPELERVRELIRTVGTKNLDYASAYAVRLRLMPVKPHRTKIEWIGYGGLQSETVTEYPPPQLPALDQKQVEAFNKLQAAFRKLEQHGFLAHFTHTKGKAVIEYLFDQTMPEDVIDVTSAPPLRKGSTYTVRSVIPSPTDSQLNRDDAPAPAWVREEYLQLPPTVPDRVRRLALEITRGAKTKHEKARAIEAYLRKLKYDTDMPPTPPGQDFVDYFLFHQKRGYCTYYASAMVVMLRELGIPARVVTGFAPGQYNTQTGKYVVTEAQAHAWPQVYYDKYGWVNYEPTPIRAPVMRGVPQPGKTSTKPSTQASLNGRYGISQPCVRFDITNYCHQPIGTGGAVQQQSGPPAVLVALGGLVGGLALLCGLTLLLLRLRLRGLSGARRQYAKLLHLGMALGVSHPASQTPTEYGRSLAVTIPSADRSISSITSQYVAEVFGRRRGDGVLLGTEWNTVMSQAIRRAPSRALELVRAFRRRRLARRLSER